MIDFNYERETVEQPLTVKDLLEWIGKLHSEMCDLGLAIDNLSTESSQQLAILAQHER